MKFLIIAEHSVLAKESLEKFENEFNENIDSSIDEHPLAKKTKFKSPIVVRVMYHEVREGYELVVNLNIPKMMMILLGIKKVITKSIEEYLTQCGVEYKEVKLISGGI